MNGIEGVLVVDKPAGPTSHDVVEEVRRVSGELRVGHTGTLDPFATGVLPLCIGRATRLARFLVASRKLYAGLIRLGVATDTYDASGTVISRCPTEGIDGERVRETAARFTGDLMQSPPPFSAKKVNGRPMHQLARKGLEVPLRPVPVTVFRFSILDVDGDAVRFEAETSSGTYVRSLARDLGESLGCGAHLVQLRRLASGSFRVEEAHDMEEVRARGARAALDEVIVTMNDLDLGLPTVRATQAGAEAMRHGRPLTRRDLASERFGSGACVPVAVRVEDERGNLLGVALQAMAPGGEPILRPDVVLCAR